MRSAYRPCSTEFYFSPEAVFTATVSFFGFWVLGSKLQGSGFRGLGFSGLGFGALGIGFKGLV